MYLSCELQAASVLHFCFSMGPVCNSRLFDQLFEVISIEHIINPPHVCEEFLILFWPQHLFHFNGLLVSKQLWAFSSLLAIGANEIAIDGSKANFAHSLLRQRYLPT